MVVVASVAEGGEKAVEDEEECLVEGKVCRLRD